MAKPLVSAIMTVYNGEKFVEESLQSLLMQDFRDFEVGIILDGCTDNTEKIVSRVMNNFPGSFFISIKRSKEGISARRNELVERAEGKYIAIQDADDISFPNRFSKEVEYLNENPDVFCIGSWVINIDEEGNDIRVSNYPPENHVDITKMVIEDCRNPIMDPTTMFRKKDFLELGGYSTDKEIWTVPDFDLWLRAISARKKFHNFQEPLIKYRINSKGVTRSKKMLMIQHHMRAWKKFKAQSRLKR